MENPSGGTISFDNIFSSMLIVIIIAGSKLKGLDDIRIINIQYTKRAHIRYN